MYPINFTVTKKKFCLIKQIYQKECDICHYWYFKDIGFKQERQFCNGYHDLMQNAMGFNNFAIVYI